MPKVGARLVWTGTTSGFQNLPGSASFGPGTYAILLDSPISGSFFIDAVGGGGGGAGLSSLAGSDAGGGGGLSKTTPLVMVPGVTYNLVVGAAGVGSFGLAGTAGGPTTLISSVPTTIISLGGGGAGLGAGGAGGTGGTATVGSGLVVGGAGGSGGGNTFSGNPGAANASGTGGGGGGAGRIGAKGGDANPATGTTLAGGTGGIGATAGNSGGDTGGGTPGINAGGGGGGAGALLDDGTRRGGGGGGGASDNTTANPVTKGGDGSPGRAVFNGLLVTSGLSFPNCITPDSYTRHRFFARTRLNNYQEMFHPAMVIVPTPATAASRRIHIKLQHKFMRRIILQNPDSAP